MEFRKGSITVHMILALGISFVTIQVLAQVLAETDELTFLRFVGLVPQSFSENNSSYQIFSYWLVHIREGHLFQNILIIGLAGYYTEPVFSKLKFLVLIIGAATVAGVSHMVRYPLSAAALHGASGIGAGLIGSAMVIAAARLAGTRIIRVIGALFAPALAFTFGIAVWKLEGVSGYIAHLSGFCFGFYFTLFAMKTK